MIEIRDRERAAWVVFSILCGAVARMGLGMESGWFGRLVVGGLVAYGLLITVITVWMLWDAIDWRDLCTKRKRSRFSL